MPRYNRAHIRILLNNSDNAPNPDAKGRIFEDLVLYLFDRFNGMRLADRNILDATGSQELDLALWNNRLLSQFDFLDPIVLCECKNETPPLSSQKVREFVNKLRTRGANTGVLVTSSGITGQLNGYRYANSAIIDALTADKIKVLVVDRDEILSLSTTNDFYAILSDKYLNLTLRRTND
jgi:hypothetical protein